MEGVTDIISLPNIVKILRFVSTLKRKRTNSQVLSMSNEYDEDEFIARQFGDERGSNRADNDKEDEKPERANHLDPGEGPPPTKPVAPETHPFRVGSPDESFYDEEEDPEDEMLKHPFSDFVVDPTGDLYYAWQGIVGISVFYNIIFTIMRIAFEQLEAYRWLFWIADILTDVIYATDMIIQMNISYIDDGIYVTDKQQLKENYMRTKRFTYDAVAILPLPYATLVIRFLYWIFRYLIGLKDFGMTVPISEITLLGFCRLPRLAKYKALSEFFASMESRTNAPDTFRAFNLIVYLLLIIHWIACVYYCISWFEGFGMNSWVYPATEEGDDDHKFLRKYTVCFYWSFLTLTTIGGSSDPETNLEYLFTGLTFFNGVFVFAAVVGNVGDVISNMNAARTEFQAKVDDIKRYMVHHRVPDSLQKRVKKWFDYSWGRTHGVDESSLLETLPDKLRARIQIQIHLKTLKKVTIFEKCETGLLCELVLKLRPQIFSPRDYVCRRNEIGKEMYIINHGKLECIVTTESGERIVVATLTEGKYFGEIALLSFEGNNRRTADVRSVGYSELLVLSKKALMSALVDYPEARKQLEYQAQLRISSNRKMSSALKENSSGSVKTNGSDSLLKKTLRGNVDPNKTSSDHGDRRSNMSGGRNSFRDNRNDSRVNLQQVQQLQSRQLDGLKTVLQELKSFDSMATKQKIHRLETTISCLKNSIIAKTNENEEAVAKLRALQELHTPKRPVSGNGVISNGHGLTSNGHDTKLSRSSKLRNLSDRLNEQASLEQHVSDRTRKILENMRRERSLSSTSQALNTSPQPNLNNSSRRSSLSRQTSFLIEGNPEQKGSDDQSDQSSAARDSTHTSISNLVRECELPTVKKYLKQSGETERRAFNRTDSKCSKRPKKRRPSNLAQLDTIPGSSGDGSISLPRFESGLARCLINNHSKLVSPESGFEESNYLEGPVTVNSLEGDNNRSTSVDLPMGKNHPLLSSFSEKPREDEENILSDSSSGSSSIS
ncbi:cGMP-gated cation channel alpha-1-like isoform X2 [Bolinopsis microptera]|uniref:cGMP-gated cation channel alpha-1-like isoform X2 n=1 Tax=Bolinopsis microptera TaxID=2820187 RepID=UPI0030798C76